MKIIINAVNLLGDSLYSLPAIDAFSKNPDNQLSAIVADAGLAYDMFSRVFAQRVPLFTSEEEAKSAYPDATVLYAGAGQAAELSYAHHQLKPEQEQMHMIQAYAVLLGVNLQGNFNMPSSLLRNLDLPKKYIAISPFSRSCSRHTGEVPNKTLDDWKWESIIRYLRHQGYPVKVIAGPNDILSNCSVAVDDYFTARSFDELEEFLAQCALVVTLDNGLGHIVSLMNVYTISLWPKVSNLKFIMPLGERTAFINMEPNSASPAQLLHGIKHFTRMMLSNSPQNEMLVEE